VSWNIEVKFPAWAVTVYSPLLPGRLCCQPNFNIQVIDHHFRMSKAAVAWNWRFISM